MGWHPSNPATWSAGRHSALRSITQGLDEQWEHCPLRLPVRPATEGIEDGGTGWLEIRYVARYDGEPVFERRGRDHQIGAVVAETGAQGAPTPRGSQVEWHDPLAVEGQDAVQPVRKSARKAWISRAPSRNAALYFTNADDAEEKIGRALPFEPLDDHRIAFPPAQFG